MTIGATITAVKQSNITLKCVADGLPAPKITWQKNGVVLQQQNGRRYTIEKAKKTDTGTYQCTAYNLAGSRSALSLIKIQGNS
jgi:ribosomal protein L33